jgi:small subunit ribosomal protein S2
MKDLPERTVSAGRRPDLTVRLSNAGRNGQPSDCFFRHGCCSWNRRATPQELCLSTATAKPTISAKELIEAGVHFGHRASRWNPKMRPYIYGRRNLIHIIDVKETVRGLLRAKKYLRQVAAGGSLILFVGTKRQASEPVEREASSCGMPRVSDRWLGGTLTNFRTIRNRLTRLEELEGLINSEQFATYSKKMQSALKREYRKMFRNLNGMRTMNRLPECLVIIDPKKEHNAVREANKLGIATVALIDTDCDPDKIDLPIPGNDDSIRSIEIVLKQLAEAVLDGKNNAAILKQQKQEGMMAAASVGGGEEE